MKKHLSLRLSQALVVAILVSALVAAPASADPGGPDPAPDPGAAMIEQQFLSGMVVHHRGAIMMAEMALEKATRQELKDLAQAIIDAQQREIGQMSHWLKDWYGQEPPSGTTMPMDQMAEMMPMLHGRMPDMAARMERLRTLSGPAFDVEFLSMMTDHHAMAVMMATTVLIGGHHADLYTLAEDVVISQGQEIRQMDEWLDRFYGVQRALDGPTMPTPMPMGS